MYVYLAFRDAVGCCVALAGRLYDCLIFISNHLPQVCIWIYKCALDPSARNSITFPRPSDLISPTFPLKSGVEGHHA